MKYLKALKRTCITMIAILSLIGGLYAMILGLRSLALYLNVYPDTVMWCASTLVVFVSFFLGFLEDENGKNKI